MSHASSSRDLNWSKQFTSVRLTGGVDCDLSVSQFPDLFVKGGARIKKNLCLGGNLVLTNSAAKITADLVGDLCGDTTVFGNLDVTQSLSITENISVVGNVNVTGVINAAALVVGNLISEKITGDLQGNICSSTQIFGNATILGNLTVLERMTTIQSSMTTFTDNKIVLNDGETGPGVTLGSSGVEIDRGSESNYHICFEESRNCTVVGETGSTCCVATREDSPVDEGVMIWDNDTRKLITDSFLTVQRTGDPLLQVAGNVNVSGNVNANQVNSEKVNTNDLFVDNLAPNSSTDISLTSDVNMNSSDLIDVGTVQVSNISHPSGGTISILDSVSMTGVLDMNCANIVNVGTISVGNVRGKSPITFKDLIIAEQSVRISSGVDGLNKFAGIDGNGIIYKTDIDIGVMSNTLQIVNGEVDFDCANISNVNAIFVSNVYGKSSSPITVHDDIILLQDTSLKGPLDLDCRDITNVGNVELEIIKAKDPSANVVVVGDTNVTGNLVVTGTINATLASCNAPVISNAATFTFVDDDCTLITEFMGNVTVTFPNPTTNVGKLLYIRSDGANNVDSASSDVIKPFSSVPQTNILESPEDFGILQSDGSNWVVVLTT